MQSCAHVRHVAQASRKRGRVNYIHGTVCCHPERRASTVRYIATQLTGVLPLVSLTAPAAAPHRHPQPRPQLPKGARRDPSVILLVPPGPRPLSKPNPLAMAAWIAWPPSTAPCVMLNPPRKDLARPVRAVLTTNARGMLALIACWKAKAARAPCAISLIKFCLPWLWLWLWLYSRP